MRILVKYGGAAMGEGSRAWAEALSAVARLGHEIVVVHGGGPAISQTAARLGLPSRFANGLRVTDDETMAVVEMVLCGRINKEVVSALATTGLPAVGISGRDGGLLQSRKRPPVQAEGEWVDLGRVGEAPRVQPRLLQALLTAGFLPVVAPVAEDGEGGGPLNINADGSAAAVARSLEVDLLLFLTDVEGVRGKAGVLRRLTPAEAERLQEQGLVGGGMLPKLEAGFAAARQGIRVLVLDGRRPDLLMQALAADPGTRLLPEEG